MSKKASKKIKKITHIRLQKKDGDTFDFTKPYELLEENKLSVPTVDAEVGGTYIEVPDFLQFKSTKKRDISPVPDKSKHTESLLPADRSAEESTLTEQAQSVDAESHSTANTAKKGVFQQYFEEKSFSGIYRTKATFKSALFAILGGLSFCSVLFFASLSLPWAFVWLLVSGVLTVLFTSLFFVVSVDRFAVYLYSLFFGMAILLSGALGGMMNIITVGVAIAAFLMVLFAFQETERLQVINRIFDFYYIVKPAAKILNIVLVAVIALTITNAYSNQNTREVYEQWIPQSEFNHSMTEQSSLLSPVTNIATSLLEIQSYKTFVDAKKTTAFDYVLVHEYSNSLSNAAGPEAQKAAADPLISAEQKNEILSQAAYQRIANDLVNQYRSTITPDQKLTESTYSDLSYAKTLNALSSVHTSLYKTGAGFFSIQQNFSAFVLGLIVASLYTLGWLVYRLLNAILNIIGLSLEKIAWRIMRAFKVVKLETEPLESEIVVV